MKEVVLLVGTAASAGGAGTRAVELRPQLEQRIGTCRITVVAAAGSAPDLPADIRIEIPLASTRTDRLFSRSGFAAVDRLLRRSGPGRLLSSLGPVAPARVFRRAVRGDPRAIAALHDADVVIAVDAAAVLTAWDTTRTERRPRAFSGIGPALTMLGQ